jgi:serine-type D-Ala-D-Ala carboxypeptidase/endopeptidase (penicillin-binding protein 4)
MRSNSRHPTALGVVVAIALAVACAPRSSRPEAAASGPQLARLQQDLERLFTEAPADQVLWGIEVVSLDRRGQPLFEHSPDRLLLPASNAKLLTLALAAERLGWDFQFETTVTATTAVEPDGTIRGDLVVRGSGDPTIGDRVGDAGNLDDWASDLVAAGVRRIDGRVIGDDDALEVPPLGSGWTVDDVPYGYAAPMGALIYNENTAQIRVSAGPRAGAAAAVRLVDEAADLEVHSSVVTIAAGEASHLRLERLPGSTRLEVSGGIAVGADPMVRFASVDNPTLYFARALRTRLIAHGISVRGEAVDVDRSPPGPLSPSAVTLIRHRSPPLTAMAVTLMKRSQNLYAETLFTAVERSLAQEPDGEQVSDVLRAWGIEPGSYMLADGSGLSRYNLVSAATITRVLERMYDDTGDREPWMAALPVAGVDGTLENRMRGTAAEGTVRAKTGTIAYVRTLSGYASTGDGEVLAFSFLANHFASPVETRTVDAIVEKALVRLAGFHR